jgi:hypothetical protein
LTWAKLDDRANEHRKQLSAGAEACWLWACGLMYANRQPERSGFIPDLILPALYAPSRSPKKLAARLVEVGLWDRVEGGYAIHDYTTWNPSAEQIERDRAEGRRRAAESYAKRKNSSEVLRPKTSDETEPKKTISSGSGSGVVSSDLISDPRGPEFVSCPADLVLEPAAVKNLEMQSVPAWAIEILTRRFVGKYLADPGERRTVRVWSKCLFTAVWSGWQDEKQRPTKPDTSAAQPAETSPEERKRQAEATEALARRRMLEREAKDRGAA